MNRFGDALDGALRGVCAPCRASQLLLTLSPKPLPVLGERTHHGDVYFNHLTHDISAEIGILNDLDLAIWVDHSTTNIDWTGTILFMAIGLLDGGLDGRTSPLYRSGWVLYCRCQSQGINVTIEIYPLLRISI